MSIKKIALGAALLATALTAGAQGAERKPYIVQLGTAPVAAYEGGISGLLATRPAAGQRISVKAPSVQAYLRHVNTKIDSVTAAVPAARVYQRYGIAVTGFAAMLTPAELEKLRTTPGVVAITADEPLELTTSYTTSTFLGLGLANGGWSRKDAQGRDVKGENVIIAMVDTGVWPENVSVSDKVDANGKPVPYYAAGTVVYDPLPAGRYNGSCQAGQAFTAAMCNNKLVGAQVFNATFKIVNPTNVWPGEYDSPRDEDGHGSHTLTTAGGNANSNVNVQGSAFTLSGVAPRARLASYKACNAYINAAGARQNSCYTGDTMAAIDKAVADGVDVINFSIGGSETSVAGLVAQSFKGAAKAGVFVAASAGNSGPGNTVAHIAPWNATVGNSTHDRYTEALVTLGSGANATTGQGASFQTAGLAQALLIWSRDAGFGPAVIAGTNQALCYGAADGVAALLDPAKVTGKIIVCDRGGNFLVNKVANAKAAGALGVIILNRPVEGAVAASGNTTPLIVGVLPVVHMNRDNFAAVTAEARKVIGAEFAGKASFGGSFQVAGVPAPVMADTSSRGPNKGDTSILKPDITAPGTDIIAAYVPSGVSAAERAALIAGTDNGRPGANMISGTSMASPHVAGAAALLKQLNPTWSPAAIKSALMTSAAQTVKLASGAADANRWGYGAGHLNPNAALSTSVIYDITPAQYDSYNTGALAGLALNLASITASNVLGSTNVTRRITNAGASAVTLNASAALAGFNVTVTPAALTLAPGASANFNVNITRTNAPFNAYRFGNLTWTNGVQTIVSPLTARSTSIVAYTAIDDTRAAGSRIFTVGTGFTGPMVTTPTGMVAATRTNGNVAEDKEICTPVVVPAGALALRAQLFNSETQEGAATDLDLTVYSVAGNGARTLVGASENGDSNELVSLTSPAAGNYQACVFGYDTVGASANHVLNTWVVGPAVGPQTMKAAGPSNATLGGTASVVASWSVAPGARYLGRIVYSQTVGGAALGGTTLFVDASSGAAAQQAAAPVFRNKQQVR